MKLFSTALSLFLFNILHSTVNCQIQTRAELDSIIQSAHPSYHPDSTLYVINGVLLEPEKIDSVLNVMGTMLVDITFLSKYKHQLSHLLLDIILITGAYSQKNKTKEKELSGARHLFLPPGRTSPVQSPVLFIDNHRIRDADAFSAVKKLKRRKLYFIHYSEPGSNNFRAAGFPNGVLRIFSKNYVSK